MTLSDLELSRFFFAIVALLVAAHGVGHLFHQLHMPRVVGEIVGGLLLGPTLLGHFLPDVHHWIFNAFEHQPRRGKGVDAEKVSG